MMEEVLLFGVGELISEDQIPLGVVVIVWLLKELFPDFFNKALSLLRLGINSDKRYGELEKQQLLSEIDRVRAENSRLMGIIEQQDRLAREQYDEIKELTAKYNYVNGRLVEVVEYLKHKMNEQL